MSVEAASTVNAHALRLGLLSFNRDFFVAFVTE
jgi:hypothetical protein